jgi:hypothetical protein
MTRPGRRIAERLGSRRLWRRTSPLLLLLAAACAQPSDTSLLDAYLEPQRPIGWGGLPPPSPVPEIARNTQLVGMATSDLKSVFGEPALVRTEGAVQYWRYSFTGCILDLFVNTDQAGGSEVAYFDLRPNGAYGNGTAERDCDRLGERLAGVERLAPSRDLPPVESF